MEQPPKLSSEAERLETLRELAILDTLPEKEFDDIAAIASELCGTPIALISLLDEDRQWFKSRHGFDVPETPRDVSFCGHAVAAGEAVFEVPDALHDERFHDNPLVTGNPSIRFYAGAPLIADNGARIGTLCVIDTESQRLTETRKVALRALANQVISLIELRRLKERERALRERCEREARALQLIFDTSKAGLAVVREPAFIFEQVNEAFKKLVGPREYLNRKWADVYEELPDSPFLKALTEIYKTGRRFEETEREVTIRNDKGELEPRVYNVSYDRLEADERGAYGVLIQASDVTEEVNTRRALETESRARAAAGRRLIEIMKAIPVGISIFEEPEHRYAFVNDTHATYYGGRTDFVGRKLVEAVPELAGSPLVNTMNEVYRTGVPFSATEYPVEINQADGSRRKLSLNLSFKALRGPEGAVEGLITTVIDMTEFVQNREELISKHNELHETERLLKAATDVAKIGFFDWNMETDVFRVSEQFSRDWGVESGVSLGDLFELILPEDREPTRRLIDRATVDGEHYHAQYRVRRKTDGVVVWIDAQGRVTKDDQGRPRNFFGTSIDITRKKELESDTFTMVNSIPQLAWMSDARGQLYWYNQVWQEFTGTSQDEMQKLGWAPFHHPDRLGDATRKWYEHIESGQPWEDTFPLRNKDGEYRTFLSRAVPVRDVSGKITKWFGTNTDITESARAHEELSATLKALKISEAEVYKVTQTLEAAIEVAQIGFWSVDPETNSLTVDDRFLEHFGMTRDQFDGTLDAGIRRIHPADREQVLEAVERAMRGGEPYRIEYRVPHDQSVHWIEARGALKDNESGVARFMGSTMEITQRKTAELKLETERALLDQIFMQSPAAMAMWVGEDLVFDRVNPEYQKIFPGRTLVGRPLLEAVPELRGQGFDDLLRNVLNSGETHTGREVLSLLQPDSSKPPSAHYYNFSYISIKDGNDKPYGVYDHAIDVTETVLGRQQIEQAKRAAELASQAKSQFLANMSHEIRTPLGAIMGFASLLKDPSVGRDQHEGFVTVIERNSTQLLRIIDDILDLSKVEAGMLLIERIDFSLPELLTDFTSLMGFKAREKGIAFTARAVTKLPAIINTDPTRLRQILINAVGNAIKFTDRGRVEVRCCYNDGRLDFEIEDSGRGITPEQAENLFQPFAQADASITRKYGGTGLGLVLTRSLAEALGGSFKLKSSTIDRGSTFSVTIRASAAPDVEMVSALGFETVPAKTVAALGELADIHVLLVEDSPDNQALISIFLGRAGARTDIASDGAQGYEMALVKPYDVILMDVQMPVMDGITAIRKLRLANYAGPAIALTAHAMKEERDRCLEAGFTDFLSKPMTRNDLIAMLSKFKKGSEK